MTRRATALLTLGVLAGVGLSASVLHLRDTRYEVPPSTERLLYLRSGGIADRLMLSFDALAADVYWIRTIQHYGRDRRSARTTGRFELLQPLLDLATTLDPYFNVAYRFGAIFLAQPFPDGPNRPDQAVALLEKGLARTPNRWQYALDIGFVHYFYTRNFAAAARWFDQAAAIPRAPNWVRPLAAVTLAEGGDRQGARQLLQELATSEESWIRQSAVRGLMQLQALDELDALQQDIAKYVDTSSAYPKAWGDLVRIGWLTREPADPSGTPYLYDPVGHTAALSPQSPLGPLPQFANRR